MPKFYKAPNYTEEQIEEMEEKDMHFPYSNKYLIYDGFKRQYIPTEELLLRYGVNIHEFLAPLGRDNPNDVQHELEFISDQIYTFCDKNSGSNVETLKCIVAKGIRRGISPFRFRCMFEDCLGKQSKFYTTNDDLTKSSGVDIEQKQWLNYGVLNNEDRNIDPKVKTILMDLGLSWIGSYDEMMFGLVHSQDW